uniref:DMT family transporter n=1 Tax=Pararhizobium sp. IMCC3301 TaxID=3067904 RepID=UPI00274056F3|nr:DMT family transporter [Pararhizobium sp. IMCC3301]
MARPAEPAVKSQISERRAVFTGLLAIAAGVGNNFLLKQLAFLPSTEIAALRSVMMLVFLLPIRLVTKRQHLRWSSRLISRSLCDALATISLLTALAHLSLSIVATFMMLIPMGVTAIGAVTRREPVSVLTALFIAVGFFGAFLATGGKLGPEFGSGLLGPDASLGLSAAALGAMLYCARDAITRFYMKQDDPVNLMTASSAVTLLVIIPAALLVPWKPPGMDELMLTAMAATLFMCSSLLIATATMYGRLAVIGSTRYTAIIWAALIDGLVFKQWPSSQTLLGASIIALSGVLIGQQLIKRNRKIK